MTGFEITHAERTGWQRRAAGELAAIGLTATVFDDGGQATR